MLIEILLHCLITNTTLILAHFWGFYCVKFRPSFVRHTLLADYLRMILINFFLICRNIRHVKEAPFVNFHIPWIIRLRLAVNFMPKMAILGGIFGKLQKNCLITFFLFSMNKAYISTLQVTKFEWAWIVRSDFIALWNNFHIMGPYGGKNSKCL